MRHFLISLIFVVMVCLAQTSEARKLALLVGVDAYDDVPSLKCCVNDVKVLKDALIKIGFNEDDIQVLATGSDNFPTKKRIERKLKDIFEMAGPSDMVFLSFSGHGAQDGKRVYFCPPDVDLDDLDGSCVSIDQVMKDLENCKAKFKWVVVDACRNDPAEGARSIGGKGLQVIPTPPAGIALFQSCAKGEQSWEDRASGNGYFTKNLVAALSGEADANHDGQLTLMEVCTWTTAQTKEQVKEVENKSQKPYFSGTVSDFTLTEDLNVPKAKQLAVEGRALIEKGEYKEGIRLLDEAIRLYPKFNSWKRERDYAQKLLDQQNAKPQINHSNLTVPDDFPTIEEAYAKVKDGGIITIQPGKYELAETLEVNRNITFRGSTGKAEDVVVDCPTSNAFGITGGSSSFQNLTASSGSELHGGFYVTGGTPIIFRCVITSKGFGIWVRGKKVNPQVEMCTIKNCSTGILISEGSLGMFKNCKIYRNEIGIGLVMFGNPSFIGCKIHGMKHNGICFDDGSLGTFQDCDIYENIKPGVVIRTLSNPTFIRCKIHDGKEEGVVVLDGGFGTFKNCEIYKNKSAGIWAASGCQTVAVTSCKIHHGKGIGVYVSEKGIGSFTDCEIYENVGPGIMVRTSGNAIVTGCNIHDGKGGGVAVYDGGKGTFNNNTLKNNFVEGKLTSWFIDTDISEVKGTGNTPEIPRR